jgi:hypothetical protein
MTDCIMIYLSRFTEARLVTKYGKRPRTISGKCLLIGTSLLINVTFFLISTFSSAINYKVISRII